ncbi:tyrosine-type recombinase/integrase [Lachnospiraceae bacterium OttesenSCG-928-D06]|nr:tyrosine-type recombinase/integrase [Lachnospiraceae bacterium OttesenSCG-928-D06]
MSSSENSRNLSYTELQELLKFQLESSNISIEDVQNKIEQMKASQILEKHKKQYTIYQGNDGRFYTYLPDSAKKDKRKKLAKRNQKDLEAAIVQYYKEQEEITSGKLLTLRAFYPKWLAYKSLHSATVANIRRLDADWKKYYLTSKIIDIPIKKLTYLQLDEWAHTIIRKYDLNKVQYYNMAVIMRQSLAYAVESEIIEKNLFERVKINRKLFRATKKKPDETQVFMIDEQPQIEAEAMKDFEENGFTACLGIPLCFQLGCRIGEMVGMKWSDINEIQDGYIHIQRMEIRTYEKNKDTWKCTGYEIVEHVKSDASDRNVYLPLKAREILKQIKLWNEEQGYCDSEYIFLNKEGNRIHAKALDSRIRKYCRHIGISEKGMHKIRKTYISTLCDSNTVNLNTIRTLVGHNDERTTLRNYCFDRSGDTRIQENLEKALS